MSQFLIWIFGLPTFLLGAIYSKTQSHLSFCLDDHLKHAVLAHSHPEWAFKAIANNEEIDDYFEKRSSDKIFNYKMTLNSEKDFYGTDHLS